MFIRNKRRLATIYCSDYVTNLNYVLQLNSFIVNNLVACKLIMTTTIQFAYLCMCIYKRVLQVPDRILINSFVSCRIKWVSPLLVYRIVVIVDAMQIDLLVYKWSMNQNNSPVTLILLFITMLNSFRNILYKAVSSNLTTCTGKRFTTGTSSLTKHEAH